MQNTRHGGGAAVTIDAPAANTDLWTVYLRSQLRAWIDPLGLAPAETTDALARPIADMAAAAISGWLAFVAGEPVRAMYAANQPAVDAFIDATTPRPEPLRIPRAFTRPETPAPSQVEPWALTDQRDREPALTR